MPDARRGGQAVLLAALGEEEGGDGVRIRSTKPEFWRSERIASVDWDVRLVLKGLESYVDDNGVGKDDLALIVADVFPRDLSRNPTGTLQKVSEAISALISAGLLWRYTADGNNLIYVSFWESVQRIEKPSKGRYRRPDGTMEYRDSEIGAPFPEYSGSTPGALRPGTGEQRNRGTEDQGTDSSSETDDVPPDDPIVDQLCDYLADRIESNGSKRPPVTKKWRDACRRMLDRDQRTPEQIHAAIDWCQTDDFWRANVMSMPKLREKFDTLRLQAQRRRDGPRPPGQRIATADQRLIDGMALAARLAAEESQPRLELEA